MKNLQEPIKELPVDHFWKQDAEGLSSPCPVDGCEGQMLMVRHTRSIQLVNGAYCTLCGQRYRFTSTLEGAELEEALRGLNAEKGE
jgi:hypothetical protein